MTLTAREQGSVKSGQKGNSQNVAAAPAGSMIDPNPAVIRSRDLGARHVKEAMV